MRTYQTNSPQAAARIVALAMLVDGNLCKTELDALDGVDAHMQLGLLPAELQAVVHALCEDLLSTSHGTWGSACRVDADTLDALMAEIEDPVLRAKVLRLCAMVIAADEHLAEGETAFLSAVVGHWRRYRDNVEPRSPQPGAEHV